MKIEFPKDVLKMEKLQEARKQKAKEKKEFEALFILPQEPKAIKKPKLFPCTCCTKEYEYAQMSNMKKTCKRCFAAKCIVGIECKEVTYQEPAATEFKYPKVFK
jgi:hypothetical protein